MRVNYDFSSTLFSREKATGDTIRRADKWGSRGKSDNSIQYERECRDFARVRAGMMATRDRTPLSCKLTTWDVGKIVFDDNFTIFPVVVFVIVPAVETRSSDLDLEANY